MGLWPRKQGTPLKKKPICLLAVLAFLHVVPQSVTPAEAQQTGKASIYSSGNRTASGARLNPSALTAAHRSLPFGTKVKVTHRKTGKSVIVTITDRGPFVRGRVIDLTPAGARALGFSGLAPVTLEVLG